MGERTDEIGMTVACEADRSLRIHLTVPEMDAIERALDSILAAEHAVRSVPSYVVGRNGWVAKLGTLRAAMTESWGAGQDQHE